MDINSFKIPIIAVSLTTNKITFVNQLALDLISICEKQIIDKDYSDIFKINDLGIQKDYVYIQLDGNNKIFLNAEEIIKIEEQEIKIIQFQKIDIINYNFDNIKEDFWKSIVEKMPMVVLINNYKPIWINQYVEKISGITQNEFLNMTEEDMDNFFHPEDKSLFTNAKFQFKKNDFKNIKNFAIEYRIKHKDGRWIWVRSHYFPIGVDNNNNYNLILGTVEDITDRKELELQLQKKIEELDEALNLTEKYHKESILQEQKVYQEKLNSMQIILDRTKMQLVLFSNFIENKKIYESNIRNKIIELSSNLSENYKSLNIEKELSFSNNLQSIYDSIDDILNNTEFILDNLDNSNIDLLTIKELKVLSLLQLTLQTKAIANLLNVSVRTIETHIYNIRKKLNVPQKQSITQYLYNVTNTINTNNPIIHN